ncbi:MAG: 6-phosphogluconolactonase [Actinomycetota bacterium]
MTFSVEVFDRDDYGGEAAARIGAALPGEGEVVITGGGTAADIYPILARVAPDWSRLDVYFSDERCVPPNDDRSNFAMARRLLLDEVGPRSLHRMRGEDPPEDAAALYGLDVEQVVAGDGFGLALLGMGADAHVGALFPGSPALEVTVFCAAVDRPDGLRGLTLTPPALLSSREVLLLVTGGAKAEAVRRVVRGDEAPASCPAGLLSDHPNATFLLDEPAASRL